MIKENELRIGSNYIANGRIFLMDLKMMFAFMQQKPPYVLENITGIPITPEILKRCRFEDNTLNIGDQSIVYDDGVFYLYGKETRHQDEAFMLKIEHLHQLQNTCFYLGKEIEFS